MKIISDVDGCYCDFVTGFLKLASRMFGVVATQEDVTQWDICKALKLDDEQEALIYDKMLVPGYARDLPPYAEALTTLPTMMDRHDWYFATSPMRAYTSDRHRIVSWTSDREAWLYDHFGILAKCVIHASCKEVVRGDLLIEDSQKNIESWLRADDYQKSIAWLVDRPWNRSWKVPVELRSRVKRGTLTELKRLLSSMS
jgi:5'(3')-deoxyribonucleotidase